MKKRLVMTSLSLCFCMVVCLLSGCGSPTTGQSNAPPAPPDQGNSQSVSGQGESTEVPEETPDKQIATLYIGNQTSGFSEYPMEYTGDLTPEMLLQGITDLTGWNISLADEITTGKGGMTVVFGSDACLFTGPPEEQKDEFHVYDSLELTFMVLDSIQKTLQNWASPTNPENVDIYFAASGDQPLELSELGVIWPLEQPYSHNELESLLMQK